MTEKEIKRLELEMDIAATNLEFERAAELRDMILELKEK
jgi:excinuclease UvrABC helicase subunit UvrB